MSSVLLCVGGPPAGTEIGTWMEIAGEQGQILRNLQHTMWISLFLLGTRTGWRWSGNGLAPRESFFLHIADNEDGTVFVCIWKDGTFLPPHNALGMHDSWKSVPEEFEAYRDGVLRGNFIHGLGAASPKASESTWARLTSFITVEILARVRTASGLVSSSLLDDEDEDEDVRRRL